MRKQPLAFLTFAFFSFSLASTAQNRGEDSVIKKSLADTLEKYPVVAAPQKEDSNELMIFTKVDVKASVNMRKWKTHLEKNLLSPIQNAAKKGMKAGYYTVLVRFLVEKDGSLTGVKAINDPGFGLAEASENVVRTGPQWNPGEQNGRKVRSYYTQPITFVISDK